METFNTFLEGFTSQKGFYCNLGFKIGSKLNSLLLSVT